MYIFEGDNANISLLNEASLPVGLARSVVAAKASKSNTKARFMATSGPCSDRRCVCGGPRVGTESECGGGQGGGRWARMKEMWILGTDIFPAD